MVKLHPIVLEDAKEIVSKTADELRILENKNILITGGAGMLGRHIVYAILYANEHILKHPVRLYLVSRQPGKFFGENKNINYINIDIAKTIPQVNQIHYIIHAASLSAPKIYTQYKLDTLAINILGLYNLIRLCKKSTKSFLFFSSAEIYGSPKFSKPVDEKYIGTFDHLNERSSYVEGKRAAETICLNYFFEKKYPMKIARIFHTFGPGLRLDDGRALSDFLRNGLDSRNIEIHGDTSQVRSFLYTKDAAIMFIKLLVSEKNGEVYNIGNSKNAVSIEGLAELICKIFNEKYNKNITVVINSKEKIYFKHAVKSIIPNIQKFEQNFHYSPDTDIETGLIRTINSCKKK